VCGINHDSSSTSPSSWTSRTSPSSLSPGIIWGRAGDLSSCR
jgi:hypothetical protein